MGLISRNIYSSRETVCTQYGKETIQCLEQKRLPLGRKTKKEPKREN